MGLTDHLIPLLGRLYRRTVRPYCPRKVGVFNGIPSRKQRLFDTGTNQPDWEERLIQAIRTHALAGDTCVVIGAGFGIATTAAAKEVGESGEVIAFEAAADRYDIAVDTVTLNQVDHIATVNHAVVGDNIAVKGDLDGASVVAPDGLPPCDLLVMDCEGAELGIIRDIDINPRTIIVETHGEYNSPADEVMSTLEKKGYKILSCVEDNPDHHIHIVTAANRGKTSS